MKATNATITASATTSDNKVELLLNGSFTEATVSDVFKIQTTVNNNITGTF